MSSREVPYTYQLDRTLEMLTNGGLLLASTREDGTSNVMTIGWASLGVIWGLPVMIVLVRPSRYTYQFIEASQVFTVNVPTQAMRPYVSMCGTKSGRQLDKLADVSTSIGQRIEAVVLDECPLVYECKVIHSNDVIPANLAPDVAARSYPHGDYHRLYYGHILGAFAK